MTQFSRVKGAQGPVGIVVAVLLNLAAARGGEINIVIMAVLDEKWQKTKVNIAERGIFMFNSDLLSDVSLVVGASSDEGKATKFWLINFNNYYQYVRIVVFPDYNYVSKIKFTR